MNPLSDSGSVPTKRSRSRRQQSPNNEEGPSKIRQRKSCNPHDMPLVEAKAMTSPHSSSRLPRQLRCRIDVPQYVRILSQNPEETTKNIKGMGIEINERELRFDKVKSYWHINSTDPEDPEDLQIPISLVPYDIDETSFLASNRMHAEQIPMTNVVYLLLVVPRDLDDFIDAADSFKVNFDKIKSQRVGPPSWITAMDSVDGELIRNCCHHALEIKDFLKKYRVMEVEQNLNQSYDLRKISYLTSLIKMINAVCHDYAYPVASCDNGMVSACMNRADNLLRNILPQENWKRLFRKLFGLQSDQRSETQPNIQDLSTHIQWLHEAMVILRRFHPTLERLSKIDTELPLAEFLLAIGGVMSSPSPTLIPGDNTATTLTQTRYGYGYIIRGLELTSYIPLLGPKALVEDDQFLTMTLESWGYSQYFFAPISPDANYAVRNHLLPASESLLYDNLPFRSKYTEEATPVQKHTADLMLNMFFARSSSNDFHSPSSILKRWLVMFAQRMWPEIYPKHDPYIPNLRRPFFAKLCNDLDNGAFSRLDIAAMFGMSGVIRAILDETDQDSFLIRYSRNDIVRAYHLALVGPIFLNIKSDPLRLAEAIRRDTILSGVDPVDTIKLLRGFLKGTITRPGVMVQVHESEKQKVAAQDFDSQRAALCFALRWSVSGELPTTSSEEPPLPPPDNDKKIDLYGSLSSEELFAVELLKELIGDEVCNNEKWLNWFRTSPEFTTPWTKVYWDKLFDSNQPRRLKQWYTVSGKRILRHFIMGTLRDLANQVIKGNADATRSIGIFWEFAHIVDLDLPNWIMEQRNIALDLDDDSYWELVSHIIRGLNPVDEKKMAPESIEAIFTILFVDKRWSTLRIIGNRRILDIAVDRCGTNDYMIENIIADTKSQNKDPIVVDTEKNCTTLELVRSSVIFHLIRSATSNFLQTDRNGRNLLHNLANNYDIEAWGWIENDPQLHELLYARDKAGYTPLDLSLMKVRELVAVKRFRNASSRPTPDSAFRILKLIENALDYRHLFENLDLSRIVNRSVPVAFWIIEWGSGRLLDSFNAVIQKVKERSAMRIPGTKYQFEFGNFEPNFNVAGYYDGNYIPNALFCLHPGVDRALMQPVFQDIQNSIYRVCSSPEREQTVVKAIFGNIRKFETLGKKSFYGQVAWEKDAGDAFVHKVVRSKFMDEDAIDDASPLPRHPSTFLWSATDDRRGVFQRDLVPALAAAYNVYGRQFLPCDNETSSGINVASSHEQNNPSNEEPGCQNFNQGKVNAENQASPALALLWSDFLDVVLAANTADKLVGLDSFLISFTEHLIEERVLEAYEHASDALIPDYPGIIKDGVTAVRSALGPNQRLILPIINALSEMPMGLIEIVKLVLRYSTANSLVNTSDNLINALNFSVRNATEPLTDALIDSRVSPFVKPSGKFALPPLFSAVLPASKSDASLNTFQKLLNVTPQDQLNTICSGIYVLQYLYDQTIRDRDAKLEAFFQAGGDANLWPNHAFAPPLVTFTIHRQIDAADILLRAGADPTIHAPGHLAFVHAAARHGATQLFRTVYSLLYESPPDENDIILDRSRIKDKIRRRGPQGTWQNDFFWDSRCNSNFSLRQPGGGMSSEHVMGCTALHLAAFNGHNLTVEFFLNYTDIDPNVVTEAGTLYTPAHLAAKGGSRAALLVLDRSEIDLNRRDANGMTPLHIAADNGFEKAGEILADMPRVHLNIVDDQGRTPFSLAISKKKFKFALMIIKNARKRQIPSGEIEGIVGSSFVETRGMAMDYFIEVNNANAVDWLYQDCPNLPGEVFGCSCSFVIKTVQHKSWDVLRQLINPKALGYRGACQQHYPEREYDLLTAAVPYGLPQFVLFDIVKSYSTASISWDDQLYTPIHALASTNNILTLHDLLAELSSATSTEATENPTGDFYLDNVDPEFSCHLDTAAVRNPRVKSVINKSYSTVNPMSWSPVPTMPLHIACHGGYADMISELIRAGAKPDIPDASGYTPLLRAVQSGNYFAVGFILEVLPRMRLNDGDFEGRTAVMIAAEKEEEGSFEIFQLLMNKDVGLDVVDSGGQLVGHYVARNRNPWRKVTMLMQKGHIGLFFQPDYDGKIPLMSLLFKDGFLEHGMVLFNGEGALQAVLKRVSVMKAIMARPDSPEYFLAMFEKAGYVRVQSSSSTSIYPIDEDSMDIEPNLGSSHPSTSPSLFSASSSILSSLLSPPNSLTSPLFLAVSLQKVDLISLFVKFGASVDVSIAGKTLLQLAIERNLRFSVERLVALGATLTEEYEIISRLYAPAIYEWLRSRDGDVMQS